VIDYIVDFIFLLDIICTFNMAYYNSEYVLIDKRKTIACKYAKSWLIIDVLAIVPFGLFLKMDSLVALIKFSKVTKLTKLSRMFKLIRLMKVVKERDTIAN